MKNEKNIYKTSQRELLLDFLRSHPDEEFSTEEITGALCGKAIGKSTVYRLISKLCEDGDVLRTRGAGGKKILYRYIDKSHACDEHFHLKCRDCGKIIHLDCDFMAELEGHIAGAHGFRLDPKSTVINGICAECEKKESIE
ncbi:MAG: transcriptional repressor [Clostridia bacterium]|nr:transcriptional repressor [Clostridia bacterium]MBQ8862477.1 transcriptional repressor [Clostridia bacterium]